MGNFPQTLSQIAEIAIFTAVFDLCSRKTSMLNAVYTGLFTCAFVGGLAIVAEAAERGRVVVCKKLTKFSSLGAETNANKPYLAAGTECNILSLYFPGHRKNVRA